MKKQIFSKAFSLLVILAMVFTLSPAALAAEENPVDSGLYPDAVYDTTGQFDSDGKWIYRNLLPDEEEMTDTSMLWYNQGGTTGSIGISDDAKVGGKSIYAKKSGYNGFGFEVELLEAGKYITSFYAKGNYDTENIDETDKNVSLYPYYFAENNTSGSYVQKQIKHNSVAAQWGYFSNEFEIKASEISDRNDAAPNAMYFNVFMDKVNDVRPTNEVWIDAWTLRRVLPESADSSYVKAISPAQYVNNGGKMTFTFSLDIDPRTVVKENILVNGVAGANVSDVAVTTDEATRETTLEITLSEMTEGEQYTIDISSVKDAWGRDVVGAKTVSVYCHDTATETYTIFNDLDASGQWKYRELVPDVECERIDDFTNIGSKRTIPNGTIQTDTELNTDYKVSGNSSLYRMAAENRGIGFAVPEGALEAGADYVATAWMRSDMENNGTGTMTKAEIRVCKNADTPYGSSRFLTDTWAEYKIEFSPSGADTTFGIMAYPTGSDSAYYKETDVNGSGRIIYSIYVDDWSVRRVPENNLPATKVSSAAYDRATNTVTYKFNLDVDLRTVRKADIAVNGEANSALVKSANLALTNELTREHTLTVELQNLDSAQDYTVTLPNLKDAWGREVTGSNAVTIDGIAAAPVIGNAELVEATGRRTYSVTGIQNKTAAPCDMAALIALYNADKKCIDVKMDRKTFAVGTTDGSLAATVTIPENLAEGWEVKTFIWDMTKLIPYNK